MSRVDLARWAEIRERFDELVDLEAGERDARLGAIKRNDPELGRAIEYLIALDPIADQRLQGMTFAAADLLANTGRASFDVADPLNLIGRTISHFQVLEPVASGGMGVVYRAVDTPLNRVVALKFPLPFQAVDGAAGERLLREARSAGALDHPNVCSVHEVGVSDDGHWFLAMPFYAGQTLQSLISASAPLPVAEALEIARQIADGLACAHGAGIVHRDLKPGNVMVLPDGTVRILDFGLARLSDPNRPASSEFLGTAAYMAPEQIRGGNVDGRTDLWALGVVLYEMLLGQRPFSGQNEMSIAHAVMHQPILPSPLRQEIPRPVEAMMLNLLQKDPADRYPEAQALAADLAAVLRGEKPDFRRSPHRHAMKWLRGRAHARSAAGIAVVLFALATVAFAGQKWLPSKPPLPTKNAEAYDLFVRAQEYESRAWTMHEWNPEWHKAAETLYRRALQLDPGFALAHAELGDLLATQQFDIRQRSPDGLEAVRREAEAALKLEPGMGVARMVMSFYWEMRGDVSRALAEARLAREAAPADAETHSQVAGLYVKLGQWDDALAAFRQGAKLDPKRGAHLARFYTQLRRYDDAARAYDQYLLRVPDDYASKLFKAHTFLLASGNTDSLTAVLRRVPSGWDPDGFATRMRVTVARRERRPGDALAALATTRSSLLGIYHSVPLMRAVAYSEAGDVQRAADEFEIARAILTDSVAAHPDRVQLRIELAQALAGTGRSAEAIREAEAALALSPRRPNRDIDPKVMTAAAAAFAMAHEHDRAIGLLERLLEEPSAGLYASKALLRGDPTWDRLRDDPRFRRLAAD